MRLVLSAMSGGVIVLYYSAFSPPNPVVFGLFFVACLLFLRDRTRIMAATFVGFSVAALHVNQFSDQMIPVQYERKTVLVEGEVCSLPERRGAMMRFDYCLFTAPWVAKDVRVRVVLHSDALMAYIDSASVLNGSGVSETGLSGYLRTNVRLIRPRGLANPAGFSMERWLYAKGYSAQGVIQSIDDIGSCQRFWSCQLTHYRQLIRNRLMPHLRASTMGHFVLALTLGDRSEIPYLDKSILRDTGLGHLIAISGMHLSMVGGFVYWLLALLWRRSYVLQRYLGVLLPVSVLLVSTCFALVSGFAVSTQRALLMALVVMLWFYGYRPRPSVILLTAAAILLLSTPAYIYDLGFWLSCYAVAVLMLIFARRLGTSSWLSALFGAHFLVFFGLLPLLVLFALPVTPISIVANIFAVPLFTLILLPLSFLIVTSLLMGFVEPAQRGLQFFDMLLLLLRAGLHGLVSLCPPVGFMATLQGQWHVFLSFFMACFVILLPIPVLSRGLCVVIWAGILIFGSAKHKQTSSLAVLDVGQGLAVVIQHGNKGWMYDFGRDFAAGLPVASAILIPYLQRLGLESIDTAVLSHGDQDHQGGLAILAKTMSIRNFFYGHRSEPQAFSSYNIGDIRQCRAGQRFHFDEHLSWQVLWPITSADANTISESSNARSCVIKLDLNGVSFLLSGDISAAVERELVTLYRDQLRTDVLVAAHHGSNSSSSWAFLKFVKPSVAVFSSGYLNSFGHPHSDVVARMKAMSIEMYNTAQDGAVVFQPKPSPAMQSRREQFDVVRHRAVQNHFWLEAKD
ncbi:MAG: DNA internalization-related competence protein ComEC/Rec2 [Pseudomonadales bacterium]|nr:DNA internalization-related competence protein ComEC/Rec2 [Pseudomonadales bacterium]